MTPEMLAAVMEARRKAQPIVVATCLPDGLQNLLPDPSAPDAWNAAAVSALDADRSETVTIGEQILFLHVFNPPLRVVIVGAVHIAQALVPMAMQLGYGVVVVDPRRSFATDERFPNVSVLADWPDEALDSLSPDSRTAVVTLTHDPKLDDPALDRALKSRAFYIGALGSRKTHGARLQRLQAMGHVDPAVLARIRGPIGLNLQAVTAPEIALSIIAEIVAVRRGAALGRKAAA